MTINYSKQVLLKRGNTAVSSTYIGPVGEVTVDTDLGTIRVHDGVTPGGQLSTSSASGETPPSSPRESGLWYDTISGRLYVYYDGAWVDASPAGDVLLNANVANLSAQVTGLTSDVANVEVHIASLDANIGAFETAVNVTVGTINSNINSLNQTIAAFEANAGPTSDAWVDDAPPDISNVGALWYDDVSGRLYVYYDGAWVDANPPVTTGFGNVLPSANVTYSLGSEQYQWKDLWVSNNTIYIGNTPITVSNGALSVGGNVVSGGNTFDQDLNTGDSVTFNSVGATVINVSQINGTNPGDELVIQANNRNWTFGTDGNLTLPNFGTVNFVDPVIGGFGTPNTTTRTPGNRIVLYPSFNGSGLVDYAIGINGDVQWYSIPDSNAKFEWYAGENKLLSLGGDGNLTLPANLSIGYIGNYIPVDGTIIRQADNEWLEIRSNGVEAVTTIGWTDDFGGGSGNVAEISFNNFPGQARIVTGQYGEQINTWQFRPDGTTTFPNDTIKAPDGSELRLFAVDGNNSSVTSQTGPIWESYVEDISTGANFAWAWIQAHLSNGVNSPEVFIENKRGNDGVEVRWTFGADGNLTLPDLTVQSTAWTGITGFGEGFSLTAADKIVTNKLYSTNETQPNQHYRLELDTNGVVVLPDGSIINGSTIRGIAGTGELNYTGITIGPNSNDAEKTWMWVDHANAYIGTNNLANTWTFGENGSLTFPSDLIIGSNPFNPGTVISQANALMTVVTTGTAATYIGWGEFGNGEPGNIALVAFNDDAGAVAIQTGATTGPEAFNEWIFDADGNLTLPGKLWARASDSGSIAFTNDGTTERGYLKVDAGYNMVVNAENNYYVKRNGTDRLAITDTTSDFKATTDLRFVSNLAGSNKTWTFNSTGILTLPSNSYIETTDANLKVGSQGTVTIRSNAATFEGLKSWTFGTDGRLAFPGTPVIDTDANNFDVIGAESVSLEANAVVNIYTDTGGSAYQWQFGTDGSLTFPTGGNLIFDSSAVSVIDGVTSITTSGTANVANLIISGTAPGTLLGSAGDTAGMIRVDSNYIYYCTSTFASSSYTVGWGGATSNTIFLVKGAYPTPQVGWTISQNIYTFTIDTVVEDGGDPNMWRITYTGVPYGSAAGGTATLTNPNPATIWSQTPLAATTYANTNVAAYLAGNVTTGNIIATQYNFTNGANILANVVTKVTSSWTVTTGTNTYSFTVPSNGTYQLWVIGNIPNGIIAYNAIATVTNSNVPVVGQQFAWVYDGAGTPIDFTSIPNQFTGTANTIVRSSSSPSITTNRFDFGINNTSGGAVTVTYGYIKL